jgi:hypothetical protein
MHCDYQLAYYPITYIVALAFFDNTFENDRLMPELIWPLRVHKRLRVLPLRWKKSKLETPLLPRTEQRRRCPSVLADEIRLQPRGTQGPGRMCRFSEPSGSL